MNIKVIQHQMLKKTILSVWNLLSISSNQKIIDVPVNLFILYHGLSIYLSIFMPIRLSQLQNLEVRYFKVLQLCPSLLKFFFFGYSARFFSFPYKFWNKLIHLWKNAGEVLTEIVLKIKINLGKPTLTI